MQLLEINTAPAIGTPCDRPGSDSLAYVVAVRPATGRTFTLCGGPAPMARDAWELTIASETQVSEVSENIAAPMIRRAAGVPPISAEAAAALWERAKVKQAEGRNAHEVHMQEREAAQAKAREDLARLAPPWAAAAIVAELHRDDSDSMTDYFNHITTRTVVIGWSRHTRDLFPELRKAAATFAETADLATAPDSAEHREKYSMGAGFYLKAGGSHRTGWAVRKRAVRWLDVPGLEFAGASEDWLKVQQIIGAAVSDSIAEHAAPVGRLFTISQHTHTKKGFRMWIATLESRVERSEFDTLSAEAKRLGGWYSRPWNGTPGGFAFKSEAAAAEFVTTQARESV